MELGNWARWLGAVFGLVAGAFGGVAVFRTTNGAGSSTLIVVAVAFLLMAVTGRIPKITFPGGGGVSYDVARALTHEQQLSTAMEMAGQGKEDEADAIVHRTLADVAQHRGVADPDQAVSQLRAWPALKDLTEHLRAAIPADVQTEQLSEWGKPRIVVTVGGTRYGLWTLAGTTWNPQRAVKSAFDGAKQVGNEVQPVLAIDQAALSAVQQEAERRGVRVMYRDSAGTWCNAPWTEAEPGRST